MSQSSEKIAFFRLKSKPFTGSNRKKLREVSPVDYRIFLNSIEKLIKEFSFEHLPSPLEIIQTYRGELLIMFDSVLNSEEEVSLSLQERTILLSLEFIEFYGKVLDLVIASSQLYTMTVPKSEKAIIIHSKLALVSAFSEFSFIFKQLIFQSYRPVIIKSWSSFSTYFSAVLKKIKDCQISEKLLELIKQHHFYSEPNSDGLFSFFNQSKLVLKASKVLLKIAKASKSRSIAQGLEDAIRDISQSFGAKDVELNSPKDALSLLEFRHRINVEFRLSEETLQENHALELRRAEFSIAFLNSPLISRRFAMCEELDKYPIGSNSPRMNAFLADTFFSKGVIDILLRTYYSEECVKNCGNFFKFLSPYFKPKELQTINAIWNEADKSKKNILEFVSKNISGNLDESTLAWILIEIKSGRLEPFLLSVTTNVFAKEDGGFLGYVNSFGTAARVLEKNRADLATALSNQLLTKSTDRSDLFECIFVLSPMLKEKEIIPFIPRLFEILPGETDHTLIVLKCLTVLLNSVGNQKGRFSFTASQNADLKVLLCATASTVIMKIPNLPEDHQKVVCKLLFSVLSIAFTKYNISPNERVGFQSLFLNSFESRLDFVRADAAKFIENDGPRIDQDFFPNLLSNTLPKIENTPEFTNLTTNLFIEKNVQYGKLKKISNFFIVDEPVEYLIGIELLWKIPLSSLLIKVYRYHSDKLDELSLNRRYYHFFQKLKNLLVEADQYHDQIRIENLLDLGLTFWREITGKKMIKSSKLEKLVFVSAKFDRVTYDIEIADKSSLYDLMLEIQNKMQFFGSSYIATSKEEYRSVIAMENKTVEEIPVGSQGFREVNVFPLKSPVSLNAIRSRIKDLLVTNGEFDHIFQKLLESKHSSFMPTLKTHISEFPYSLKSLQGVKTILENPEADLEEKMFFSNQNKFWYYSRRTAEVIKKDKSDKNSPVCRLASQSHLSKIPLLILKTLEREGANSDSLINWLEISIVLIQHGSPDKTWSEVVEKITKETILLASKEDKSSFSHTFDLLINICIALSSTDIINIKSFEIFVFSLLGLDFNNFESIEEISGKLSKLFNQKKQKEVPAREGLEAVVPTTNITLDKCTEFLFSVGDNWLQIFVQLAEKLSCAQKIAAATIFQVSPQSSISGDSQLKLMNFLITDEDFPKNTKKQKATISFLIDAVSKGSSLVSESESLERWITQYFIDTKNIFENENSRYLAEQLFLLIRLLIQEKPRSFITEGVLNWIRLCKPSGNKPVDWKRDESIPEGKPVKGLYNLGATCYINSFMQQLFSVESLRRLIMDTEVEDPLFNQVKELFGNLEWSKKSVVDTNSFIKELKGFDGKPINPREQADVDEFGARILSDIESAVAKVGRAENFVKIFQGEIANDVVSKECSHQRSTNEPFTIFPLPVRNIKSMSESLQNTSEWETLEGENGYFCEGCNKKVAAKKRQRISKVPPIMMFSLKRFEFDLNTYRRVKLHSRFEIPFSISVNKTELQLRGFVVHIGSSEGGHYISYVKTKGKWYELNDSEVRVFDPSRLSEVAFGGIEARSSAYLLFYQRKDADLSSDVSKDGRLFNEVERNNFQDAMSLLLSSDSFQLFVLDALSIHSTTENFQIGLEYFFFNVVRSENKSRLPTILKILLASCEKKENAILVIEFLSNPKNLIDNVISCPVPDTSNAINSLVIKALTTLVDAWDSSDIESTSLLSKFSRVCLANIGFTSEFRIPCLFLEVITKKPFFVQLLLNLRIDLVLATLWNNKSPNKLIDKIQEFTNFEQENLRRFGNKGPLAALTFNILKYTTPATQEKIFFLALSDFLTSCDLPKFSVSFANYVISFLSKNQQIIPKFFMSLRLEKNNVRSIFTSLFALAIRPNLVNHDALISLLIRLARTEIEDYLIFDLIVSFVTELCIESQEFREKLVNDRTLLIKLEAINQSVSSQSEIKYSGVHLSVLFQREFIRSRG